MLCRSQRNLSLVALALAGSLLLSTLPANAGDLVSSRLAPFSQEQGIWEQLLSWFGFGEEQWSHAAGKDDAGPAIDPNGVPRLSGTIGQGTGAATDPISGR